MHLKMDNNWKGSLMQRVTIWRNLS